MPPVFRFAPSPNGYLHLGHARSALLNSDLAHAVGGVMQLRIEDIDRTRCRPELEQAIYEDLDWLGIRWMEPVRRQSEHMAAYGDALDRLSAMGLLYPSFESRSEIARMVAERGPSWPCDPDGAPLYPGSRGSLPNAGMNPVIGSAAPFALRLDMAAAIKAAGPLDWVEHNEGRVLARPQDWGDVILARKDVPTSYHLSVVVDDALQSVTHVVRGRDLYWSTSVHRLLQALLDLPQPVYRHHPLVLDDHGRKLSKSSDATALRALRADGVTPDEIRRRVGCVTA
jgi:glutamyl-Q tRNA(Asp) synthetase